MEKMVAGPISVAQQKGLAAGQHVFDELLTETRKRSGANSVAVADLLTSFGVELYIDDPNPPNDDYFNASLRYLKEAIPAYRNAFGHDDPEVALALNSYADLLRQRSPQNPPAEVQALLEQALQIRMKSLGPKNAETRSTLVRLARLNALRSSLKRDPQLLRKADEYLRAAIHSAPDGPQGDETANKAAIELDFAKLHARYGNPRVAFAAAQNAIKISRHWPGPEACRLVDSRLSDVSEIIAKRGYADLAQQLKRELGKSACDRICEPSAIERLGARILELLGFAPT